MGGVSPKMFQLGHCLKKPLFPLTFGLVCDVSPLSQVVWNFQISAVHIMRNKICHKRNTLEHCTTNLIVCEEANQLLLRCQEHFSSFSASFSELSPPSPMPGTSLSSWSVAPFQFHIVFFLSQSRDVFLPAKVPGLLLFLLLAFVDWTGVVTDGDTWSFISCHQ